MGPLEGYFVYDIGLHTILHIKQRWTRRPNTLSNKQKP